MKAKIIRVAFRPGEQGLLIATSADLMGLYVVGQTRSELIDDVPNAIEALFTAQGQQVVVHELEDDTVGMQPWVAVPVAPNRAKQA